jgi:hypothetical protein
VVPPDSHRISRVPCYLGNATDRRTLTVTGLSPSPVAHSKDLHLHAHFLTAPPGDSPVMHAPTTPHTQPLPGITCLRFSLIRFRSPLLSESLLFSLPTGTEMFHFPVFPPHALYIQAQVTGHNSSQVSPFGHPRINARLPTPQGLSQAPTSFIGSRCQGIHHVPFIACLPTHIKQTQQNYKDARVHYPDLKQQPHPPTHRPPTLGSTACTSMAGTKNTHPHPATGQTGHPTITRGRTWALMPQNPNSVLDRPHPTSRS